MVTKLEEACNKAVQTVIKLIPEIEDGNQIAQSIGQATEGIRETLEKAKGARVKIEEQMKECNKGKKQEAKRILSGLSSKISAVEGKIRKQEQALEAANGKIVRANFAAVSRILRKVANEKGLLTDVIFKKLEDKSGTIPTAGLCKFICGLAKGELSQEKIDKGMESVGSGVTRMGLSAMLQVYVMVSKEIAFTSELEIKSSKTLRKLQLQEVLEIKGNSHIDTDSGLVRVKARAVNDGFEGWVTLKGNAGSSFLSPTLKPYYSLETGAELTEQFSSNSKILRELRRGEVVEVLVGPKIEKGIVVMRLRGKAVKDEKVGWVTLSAPEIENLKQSTKFLICKSAIAITDKFDIAAGKPIRKLDKGDSVEVLEGPVEDAERKLFRVKGRCRDGKEGWITTRGTLGTAYLEDSGKNYEVIADSVRLETAMQEGSAQVRMLEKGEVFEAYDEPKSKAPESKSRVHVRAISDNMEGFVTFVAKSTAKWTPCHKIIQDLELHDGHVAEGAKVIRSLEKGEFVEALESPSEPKADDGADDGPRPPAPLRLKIRAEKDNNVGYVTLIGAGPKDKPKLEPVFRAPEDPLV